MDLHSHLLISLIFLSNLSSQSIKTLFSNSAKEIDITTSKIDFFDPRHLNFFLKLKPAIRLCLKDFQKRGEEMNNSIFKISYFYFYYCYENVNFLRELSLNEHSGVHFLSQSIMTSRA